LHIIKASCWGVDSSYPVSLVPGIQ
jgi:hypothetical protein